MFAFVECVCDGILCRDGLDWYGLGSNESFGSSDAPPIVEASDS